MRLVFVYPPRRSCISPSFHPNQLSYNLAPSVRKRNETQTHNAISTSSLSLLLLLALSFSTRDGCLVSTHSHPYQHIPSHYSPRSKYVHIQLTLAIITYGLGWRGLVYTVCSQISSSTCMYVPIFLLPSIYTPHPSILNINQARLYIHKHKQTQNSEREREKSHGN